MANKAALALCDMVVARVRTMCENGAPMTLAVASAIASEARARSMADADKAPTIADYVTMEAFVK